MTPHSYLGYSGLAEAMGVTRHAVHKWRSRYPADAANPFPEPDVEIDGTPGWLPSRLNEVLSWRESLPGRGAGGGRPPASRRAYFAAAEARGLTVDEAQRAVRSLAEEFPEMTERDIHAWLVDSWSDAEPAAATRPPTNVTWFSP